MEDGMIFAHDDGWRQSFWLVIQEDEPGLDRRLLHFDSRDVAAINRKSI